ncbi:hypothetical protein BT96DRAFT_844831 [Gymnopus androsaceus JB14]|uniref:Uncharacterized protein n=1 Tax=Gymnopus androsaceus JB14 TaxID=1447944 RepID=A0A6A4GC17_9AGAR|nr:hypothetical protein BT96DRAFT_844831 [Gymnopus androsaceus JB14]
MLQMWFSHSALVAGKRRYNLTPEHIWHSIILCNWLKIDSLVPEKTIAALLEK